MLRVTYCDRRASVFSVEEMEPVDGWSQTSYRVYEREFLPIPDEKMWPPWYGACLKPNSAMRRKTSGRPISTWIRNEMDAIERAEKRCGLCRGEGHTRRECPNARHSDP
ncbi:hypothetical protein Ahy_B05g079243 [Arachis hypogaea]|uniref:CCHC-type domain-containing protein n=1 Tax=Arachis hypogaea TaxID=3818 RepID=A0A444Z9C4_ARAHY|nr:hypothetical protein Ahy_B05g079243 [Arachis hypogaea]